MLLNFVLLGLPYQNFLPCLNLLLYLFNFFFIKSLVGFLSLFEVALSCLVSWRVLSFISSSWAWGMINSACSQNFGLIYQRYQIFPLLISLDLQSWCSSSHHLIHSVNMNTYDILVKFGIGDRKVSIKEDYVYVINWLTRYAKLRIILIKASMDYFKCCNFCKYITCELTQIFPKFLVSCIRLRVKRCTRVCRRDVKSFLIPYLPMLYSSW